jgi:4,5-dihydroxyphthalate decarboxylase
MKLQLSLGLAANPRSRPILDGAVKADGIDLIPSIVDVAELFWRQLKFGDFDISEMSMSTLMMIKSQGNTDWIGLPIFTTRRFFHTEIWVRRGANIEQPSDLRGKRIGVPDYQQTSALWARGVIEHEFGVSPRDMQFWMERLPSHSLAGAVEFKAPPGVSIRQIPPEKSMGTMMLSGELDAAMSYNRKLTLLDRSLADLANHPDVRPLFPDTIAEGVRYFRKTGLFPINHGMMIRRSIAERHPWIVLNLLSAFEAANRIADAQRSEHVAYHIAAGAISSEAGKALREPVLAHGVKANRAVLETAAAYSFEQGLTPRLMKMEDLFAESTLNE